MPAMVGKGSAEASLMWCERMQWSRCHVWSAGPVPVLVYAPLGDVSMVVVVVVIVLLYCPVLYR